MGDISEMRGLVVAGTFLAVTIMLVALMPSQFYSIGEGRTITPPAYFESSELINWNLTKEFSKTWFQSYAGQHWGKSEFGHDMYFSWGNWLGKYWIKNEHMASFYGIWFFDIHAMHWINTQGVDRGDALYEDEIEQDFINTAQLASYTVRCQHFYMRADFAYNTTAYSSAHDAFDHYDIYVLFGISWDQQGSTWDALSLVTSVLFFKMPQINTYLNALIAIPIWIAISYISFILILRTVGAVFGGGGA